MHLILEISWYNFVERHPACVVMPVAKKFPNQLVLHNATIVTIIIYSYFQMIAHNVMRVSNIDQVCHCLILSVFIFSYTWLIISLTETWMKLNDSLLYGITPNVIQTNHQSFTQHDLSFSLHVHPTWHTSPGINGPSTILLEFPQKNDHRWSYY